jgi:hypothetical protein
VTYFYNVLEVPENAFFRDGERVYNLRIPTHEQQIVLSEMPDSNTQVIFGYVKFNSEEYLDNRTYDDTTPKPGEGIRRRADMKIYFRSDRVESP